MYTLLFDFPLCILTTYACRGFTFPLGVFTVATTTLGNELDSTAFRILGTIFAGCETLLWLVLVTKTGVRTYDGRMFASPCLGEVGGGLDSAKALDPNRHRDIEKKKDQGWQ